MVLIFCDLAHALYKEINNLLSKMKEKLAYLVPHRIIYLQTL